jgi:hypothetical protein
MEIKIHQIRHTEIAEVMADDIVIKTTEDGLNLLGNLYYQGFDRIVIYEKNITTEFFDLKNGMAGEILQKFSNYRVGLAIVGDFKKYESKSLNDFILESNKIGRVKFVNSGTQAIKVLSENDPR